jgi:hypothetical protein
MRLAQVGILVGALTLAPLSFGQSIFGEIRGTALDATGSAVPSATVVAIKTATGESRQVSTDVSGVFALVNLDAGAYDIEVERTGFRPSLTRNLALRAREIARVDIALEVAPTPPKSR